MITKLANRWVVMFTSGYNNDDGVGYLYVVDAYTGNLIQKIATAAGLSCSEPGWRRSTTTSTTCSSTTRRCAPTAATCSDGSGASISPAGSAQLIGTSEDSTSRRTAITTRPELAELNGKPMIFVGTGQLLGASDVEPANQHQDPCTASSTR